LIPQESRHLGLVEATSAAKKKWVLFGTACYKIMSVKNTPLPPFVLYTITSLFIFLFFVLQVRARHFFRF